MFIWKGVIQPRWRRSLAKARGSWNWADQRLRSWIRLASRSWEVLTVSTRSATDLMAMEDLITLNTNGVKPAPTATLGCWRGFLVDSGLWGPPKERAAVGLPPAYSTSTFGGQRTGAGFSAKLLRSEAS